LQAECRRLLKPEYSLEDVLAVTDAYFSSDIILKRWSDFGTWPQHNGPKQMELMRLTSDRILEMHRDENSY